MTRPVVQRPSASARSRPRSLTPQDRVLLLDMWQRSGLTARDARESTRFNAAHSDSARLACERRSV